MGLSPFGPNAPRPLDMHFVPHTLITSHGSPGPFRLLTSSGYKKRSPNKYYSISRSLENDPPPSSPTGSLRRELPVSRALFYVFLEPSFVCLSKSPVNEPPSRIHNKASMDRDALPEPSFLYLSGSPVKKPPLQVPLKVLP